MKENNLLKIKKNTFKKDKLPQVVIYRSNCNTYAMLINSENRNIVASVSSKEVKDESNPTEKSYQVGVYLAKKILKKYPRIIFNRRSYLFHGHVKSVAEGLIKGGIKF